MSLNSTQRPTHKYYALCRSTLDWESRNWPLCTACVGRSHLLPCFPDLASGCPFGFVAIDSSTTEGCSKRSLFFTGLQHSAVLPVALCLHYPRFEPRVLS